MIGQNDAAFFHVHVCTHRHGEAGAQARQEAARNGDEGELRAARVRLTYVWTTHDMLQMHLHTRGMYNMFTELQN